MCLCGKRELGVAASPSAPRDLSLFLNDCGPRAVEHLTRVISSMRGSGQKPWPISAVDTDTLANTHRTHG